MAKMHQTSYVVTGNARKSGSLYRAALGLYGQPSIHSLIACGTLKPCMMNVEDAGGGPLASEGVRL